MAALRSQGIAKFFQPVQGGRGNGGAPAMFQPMGRGGRGGGGGGGGRGEATCFRWGWRSYFKALDPNIYFWALGINWWACSCSNMAWLIPHQMLTSHFASLRRRIYKYCSRLISTSTTEAIIVSMSRFCWVLFIPLVFMKFPACNTSQNCSGFVSHKASSMISNVHAVHKDVFWIHLGCAGARVQGIGHGTVRTAEAVSIMQ